MGEGKNGDARCNYCDGQMPCRCERPKDWPTPDEEYEADLDARDRV